MTSDDPKPIEYELDDGAFKPPETEAEAVARLQREDENRARQIGLVREKHSAKTGKKWLDSIGGNSANAAAGRLIDQEARAAERKRQARAAGVKLVGMLLVGMVVVAGGAAAACDYMGVINLGLFPKPAPAPEPVVVQPVAAPLPVKAAPLPVKASPPPVKVAPPAVVVAVREEPPVVDPAETRRLARRLESAQRGVDSVQGDLEMKQKAIVANLQALYGIVPDPRDVPPSRRLWLAPCALIELEQATNAPRTSANAPQWNTRLLNAQARVNNLNSYLKHDHGIEKDILGRLKKAEREREAAISAKPDARH